MILVVLLTVATAGLAHAQTNNERARQMVEHTQVLIRALAVQSVERSLGVSITADRMTREQGAVYLQGNVVISFADGVVVTADDAVISNREILLGGNARISGPQR